MNFTRLVYAQICKYEIRILLWKTDRHVACYDWAVPLHTDQQSGPLDLKRDERLRSDLEAHQEKKKRWPEQW
jgi:hypothetical protein